MTHDDLMGQLKRLLTGLVDQEIRAGNEFMYDGAELHADEVADLMLPSVVCISQGLSERVGIGAFGYRFSLGEAGNGAFPLVMEQVGEPKLFLEVAPFVAEVFEGEVMDCRLDLARLFEAAAKSLHPNFDLDRDSNYGDLDM
jgi:hypothetical protein